MKKNVLRIIALVLIDQIIKIIVFYELKQEITLIPNIISLNYLENYGSAFGMFSGRIILIALDLLIIICVIKLLVTKKYDVPEKSKFGFSLVLAGGIGNLIDRIARGFVIDYIDISELINYPVFNFADILILLGVIYVIIITLITTVQKQENKE